MRTRTRRILLSIAVIAVLSIAGYAAGQRLGQQPVAVATASAAIRVSDTDPRGRAAMPERIAQIDYAYARRLMRLPTRQLERTFMGGIIPHHAAVVQMSRIALRKAQHPELKTLARAIIAGQTNQIRAFTRKLEQKYGVTPEQARQRTPGNLPRILRRVGRHLDRKVDSVRRAPAGAQFDQTFLKEVIPHHQTAGLEFQAVQAGAEDPQLILMANMGLGSQQMQVVAMMDFLVRWYGE